MTEFMTKLCCYGHKPITENVESDSDSDEFHIEIKRMLWRKMKTANERKWQLHTKAMILKRRKKRRKRKLPLKMTVMTTSQTVCQNKIRLFLTTILIVTVRTVSLLFTLSYLFLD